MEKQEDHSDHTHDANSTCNGWNTSFMNSLGGKLNKNTKST